MNRAATAEVWLQPYDRRGTLFETENPRGECWLHTVWPPNSRNDGRLIGGSWEPPTSRDMLDDIELGDRVIRHYLGGVSLVDGDAPERAAFRRGIVRNLMVFMSGVEMVQAHVWLPCTWTKRESYVAVIQHPQVVPEPVKATPVCHSRKVSNPESVSLFG